MVELVGRGVGHGKSLAQILGEGDEEEEEKKETAALKTIVKMRVAQSRREKSFLQVMLQN